MFVAQLACLKIQYQNFQGECLSGVWLRCRGVGDFVIPMEFSCWLDLRGVLLCWCLLMHVSFFCDLDLEAASVLYLFYLLSRGERASYLGSLDIRPSSSELLENMGCLKASSQLILSSSLILRHFLIKSLLLSDMLVSKGTGLVMMLLSSCSSLLAGQGVCPQIISQKMSPTDHRSDLLVQCSLLRICGDMYRGVPTIDLRIVFYPNYRFLANPKSLILHTPWLMSMFAGFRSRWMISFPCKYLNPLRMSLSILMAMASLSFFFFLMKFLRSPSSQYSVTMYMLLLVWYTSSSLTTFSWSTFFMMSISDWMDLMLQLLEKIFLSMTLTAVGMSSVIRRPRYTVAQEPCPTTLFSEKMYFSIFFSPSCRFLLCRGVRAV